MSNVPYLGSKISLVSKSEIRYEGILYTIDTKDSTIALAKVRSFGTEDRPTHRPVAPRDEIYEYIIFRTSDIKDLHVSEAAKPQTVLTAVGLPNDPAIVQHSGPVQTCPVSYAQPPFGHVCSLPAFQHHYPSQVAYQHVPSLFPPNHGNRSGTSSQTSLRKSPTIDAGVQVPSDSFHDKGSQSSLQDASRMNGRDMRQTASAPHLQRRTSFPGGRPVQRGRGGARRTRGGRGNRGAGMNVRISEQLKFDSEYDFEQANAEFQELETRLAKAKIDDSGNETGADIEDEVGYDKQKSFFDNISCEASRVAKGIPRFDWRIERKLNVETFGVSMSNSWFRRRRGRGGFRRGGGRGRGGTIASNEVRPVEPPKTVTFGADTLVTLEAKDEDEVIATIEEQPKIEEIPTIEIVVEKEEEEIKEWQEGAVAEAKEQWD